jgi:hypothetical protein
MRLGREQGRELRSTCHCQVADHIAIFHSFPFFSNARCFPACQLMLPSCHLSTGFLSAAGGSGDYAISAAFEEIVAPSATAFMPDIILVRQAVTIPVPHLHDR